MAHSIVRILATSFITGHPAAEEIVARATHVLRKQWRWLRPLAGRYLKKFAAQTRPRHRDVVQFLLHDSHFRRFLSKHGPGLSIAHWLAGQQQMQPVEAAKHWPVPPIESVGALGKWLRLSPSELQWFADLKGLVYKNSSSRLKHYHYRILTKQSGNIRIIEAPKARLKEIQRSILTEILDKIAVHPSVHGFIKGRSIKTFAAPHVNSRVVLRMDLRDFFPSFARTRVQALFRTIGYPESVSDLLGGLCTTITPRNTWSRAAFGEDPLHLWETHWQAQAIYFQPHLPQGAPTSPALANLCAYRLDCQLAALAGSAGAIYTRYADDLAFSGNAEFEKRVERFSMHVAAIVLEASLAVNHRKTRIMRQGIRQHLAGIVVNKHINVRRSDFDQLKAILTNCVRQGPESQNRLAHPEFRSHLEGRIGFVEMINPTKAKRLRAIFERIQWA
jgi:RNA-directed DNA polymerase